MPDEPVPPSRARLGTTLDSFVAAHRRVENVFNLAHYKPEGVDRDIRAIGFDVRHATQLVLDLFPAVYAEFVTSWVTTADVPRLSDESTPEELAQAAAQLMEEGARMQAAAERHREGHSEAAKFGVAVKALFFFVRSYQDAMVRLRLLGKGQAVGPRVSMSDHAKEGKPTRVFVDAQVPGYSDWFISWRDLRDPLKLGIAFEMQMVNGELGVVFTGITADEPVGLSASRSVFLGDLAEGLAWSARLARAVVDEIAGVWDDDMRRAVERLD